MGREEGGTASQTVQADRVGVTALSWAVWADLMGREREGQHPRLCGLMGVSQYHPGLRRLTLDRSLLGLGNFSEENHAEN